MLRKEDIAVIKALKQRGVYIKDIAEQVGVSPKTVSRALNTERAARPKRRVEPVETIARPLLQKNPCTISDDLVNNFWDGVTSNNGKYYGEFYPSVSEQAQYPRYYLQFILRVGGCVLWGGNSCTPIVKEGIK